MCYIIKRDLRHPSKMQACDTSLDRHADVSVAADYPTGLYLCDFPRPCAGAWISGLGCKQQDLRQWTATRSMVVTVYMQVSGAGRRPLHGADTRRRRRSRVVWPRPARMLSRPQGGGAAQAAFRRGRDGSARPVHHAR